MLKCYDLPPTEAVDATYHEDFPSPYELITKKLYDGRVPRSMLFIMQPRRYQEDTLTGNAAYDAHLSAKMVPARLTIEHMLNVWDVGESVIVPNEKDRVEIFKILSIHLKCCMIHNGDIFRGQPVNVLTMSKMDDFLDDLFPGASVSITQSFNANDGAAERFNKSVGLMVNRAEPIAPKERKRIIDDKAAEEMLSDDDGLGDGGFSDFEFGGEEEWV